MFNFEESVELLTSDIEDQSREEQEVLHDVILKAKRLFDRSANGDVSSETKFEDVEKDLHRTATHISLDSPVPYRIRDVIRLIDHNMGKLENNNNLAPYKRLKRRIEALVADPRYAFTFRNQASPDSIANIIGRIFRIPVNGRPISIMDLSGIPSEALNIVVAVISRLSFELAMWSERKIPILLVCEEAHRYIPADPTLGFNSTRRAISRIAKEGRKYGVSLAIISQRPSELEPSTLSQCSTVFSMRLSNEIDQNFVKAAVPDGAAQLLSFLPSLGTAETMVFGESVNLPMRVILNTLPEQYRPHSSSASFSQLWAGEEASEEFMLKVFEQWRTRTIRVPSNAQPRAARANNAVSAARQHMQSAMQQTAQISASTGRKPTRPMAPGQKPAAAGGVFEKAALRATAQRAEALKTQSLSDVKNMLNTAFNRGS
jgi:DNA helicase HerA-like ATPase